ncbi:MAG: GNAT family N-acetyltransferase [Anaerolineales bacterium]
MRTIEISPREVTRLFTALFDADMPAGLRCFATLVGLDSGRILADDVQHPTWVAVWEAGDGTLYVGGRVDAALLAELVSLLRRDGDVLIGFRDGDPLAVHLPPNPDYVGTVLEFSDRHGDGLDPLLARLPGDCELRVMDLALMAISLWRDDTLRRHGSFEAFLQRARAVCLMRGDDMLCEASTGPLVRGVRELGVITHTAHRGRGYATLTAAHLVRECERHGEATYWNCATSNVPSSSVARKLGYRVEREYHLRAWLQLR